MRKLINELSPELRNRAARKATLDSDRGNIQGLTAAKRKIQASKFLELPSQLKNLADKVCDKMQEYFTDMEIHLFKDNITKFNIIKVKVNDFEKVIGNEGSSISFSIIVSSNRAEKVIHRYQAYVNYNSNTIVDNESDEVYFNNQLKRQFRIGTQELPLENNGVSQREIIGMLMNLHKKINVELKQSVKQNENMKKSNPKLRTENSILEFFKRPKNPRNGFKNVFDRFNVSSEYAKAESELADYIYLKFKKAIWVSFTDYKKNGDAYLELKAAFPKVEVDYTLGKVSGIITLYRYSIGKSNPKGKVEISIDDSVEKYKLKVDSSSTANNELYYIERQLRKLQNNFNNQDVVVNYLNSTETNESIYAKKLKTENTIKGVTLNEIRRMQQLAGILPLIESSSKINESIFEKGKTYGGSKCEGGCFTGKEGLEKILKISKESPNNVFIIRDDNYSKLQPHFVKNGVIAKANTIGNPSYDLDRHKVRNLNIGKDVILSIKLVESINEAKVNKKYTHFIVDKKTNKILNGFDYKGLDNSSIQDYFMEDLKDMGLNKRDVSLSTAKSLMSKNIDPFNKSNWSN